MGKAPEFTVDGITYAHIMEYGENSLAAAGSIELLSSPQAGASHIASSPAI